MAQTPFKLQLTGETEVTILAGDQQISAVPLQPLLEEFFRFIAEIQDSDTDEEA
jgi:hypothetical protein